MVGEGGLEPPEVKPPDLQSGPLPVTVYSPPCTATKNGGRDWIRTSDGRFFKPMLYRAELHGRDNTS